jgi:hypothetical protein
MGWRRFKLVCERGIQLVSILLLAAGASGAASNDGPRAEALVRSPVSIMLDGRLDEPVWRDATVLKLVQQSPKPGEPTPYETEVRVIVTGDRIYFGFDCKDPNAAASPSIPCAGTKPWDRTGQQRLTTPLASF